MNDLERDENEIGELLRLAGKRPGVPPERAGRARRAAHAAWRGTVGERRAVRRRTLGTILAAAAMLGLATAAAVVLRPGAPGERLPVATIEALAGTGTAAAPGRGPLAVGDVILAGEPLVTGAASRIALRLSTGHSLRLDVATAVRFAALDELRIERGALYVDSGIGARATRPIEVTSALGTVRELGTRFEVRLAEDALHVRLRDGAVVVAGEAGSFSLRAGEELALGTAGTVERRPLVAHGPGWDWVAEVAPRLEIDGRTAREFLEWIARERGFSLAFRDEAAARHAERTILEGTIAGLTLDQALAAVLPTCGLDHTAEDGLLLVGRSGGSD